MCVLQYHTSQVSSFSHHCCNKYVATLQALLPNPLLVSIATLMITPTTFVLDTVFRHSQTEDMSKLKVAGGCIILLAFTGVIGRDWMLLRQNSAR
jgi:hypothetical protein